GASPDASFSDLDVLAMGPVVQDLSHDFDLYWASQSSFPAAQVLAPATPQDLAELTLTAGNTKESKAATSYMKALGELPTIQQLLKGELALEWAKAKMVSDDPAKGRGDIPPQDLLIRKLADIVGEPT